MDTFLAGSRHIPIERFTPSPAGPYPAVMILHGVDGLPGRGLPYRDLAARFAAEGYLTFLPHYFQATDGHTRPNPLNPVNFATWMEALREAIGHVLRQPEVRMGQVALVGFSLGGYLAVTVGAQDARVGAVVECCGGVADFFLRGLSQTPPILILHGEDDPVVPVSEAHRLQRLLAEHGRPHEMRLYPKRGHHFSGPDLEDAFRRTLNFLGQHLSRKVA